MYYHRGAGFAAFATGLRTLLALPDVPRRIDELAVADFLVDNVTEPRATFYCGVGRVPNASVVVLDANGERAERWWRPELLPPLVLRRDDDYVERARELLDQAVADHLRAAVPVAATLTGGLDSSAGAPNGSTA